MVWARTDCDMVKSPNTRVIAARNCFMSGPLLWSSLGFSVMEQPWPPVVEQPWVVRIAILPANAFSKYMRNRWSGIKSIAKVERKREYMKGGDATRTSDD